MTWYLIFLLKKVGDLDENPKKTTNSKDPMSALDQVDLRSPLRADERLPMPSHRVTKATPPAEKPKEAKKERKKVNFREFSI